MTDARNITLTLGGHWQNGYGLAPCPVCQSERRPDQRGLSLTDSNGRLLAYCFKSRCAFGDIARAIDLPSDEMRSDPEAEAEARQQRKVYEAKQIAKARDLWTRSQPIRGTKGETYLRARGITLPLPDTLRFMPDICHPSSCQWVSAMVALVEPTGAVHRTFLTKQGRKLERNAKMMLGACKGGSVRLLSGPGPLVVGEGIETTLSAAQLLGDRTPSAWAALSTSGMKSLQLPATPSDLIVAADSGEPGENAARSLAQRADALGWQVSIMTPPDGQDWNDVLMEDNIHECA